MRYLIITLLLLFHLPTLSAQPAGARSGEAVEIYRQGEAALLKKDYPQAARHFERVLALQPNMAAAARLLGQTRELQGRYVEAADAYRKVVEVDSTFSRTLYFQLGDVYYKMGRIDLALYYFNRFEQLLSRPDSLFGLRGELEMAQELIFRDRLESSIRACEISKDSLKFINITQIHNLGRQVNSDLDDYFPFLNNAQDRIFFTRLKKNGDEDLFISQKQGGQWRPAERMRNFNTTAPEGMSTLVRNGRRIIYTACKRDTLNGGPCDLWEALVEGTEIRDSRLLEGPVNSASWESQAAISCDGRQLFFASTRPGGLGGSDIWMTQQAPDGRWLPPVNLGAPVNTPADEEAPFISNDGYTLYFSSTGHMGLGEQDIFMSWWDKRLDRWSVPINMGPPVNGPHRELGFYLSADGRTGYFASNRPGGEGGMDIYYFELSEKLHGEPITFIEGVVLDSVLRTPIPAGVLLNDEHTLRTDDKGRFFLCAGADQVIDLRVASADHRPYRQAYPVPNWDNRSFYTLELLLQPSQSFLADLENQPQAMEAPKREKESLLDHSIYFGFDEVDLVPRELERLDGLVRQLAGRRFKNVEIIGYADDIGGDTYNLRLSEERAKSVAIYLYQNGIRTEQIHIKGEGSIRNDKPAAANRRVDIRIVVLE